MLVSIIIPVYNAGKYLKKCLESVVNQTYKDLEIIIVDDGSTDYSLEICKEFENDIRVKIIKQANHGVSYSRNVGLKEATGEFICFVDSDDELYIDAIEKRIAYDADLVITGYDIVYHNETIHSIRAQVDSYINNDDFVKFMFDESDYGYQGYIWNKLFRRDLLKGIFFDEDIYYNEDRLFIIKYLTNKCNVVCVSKECTYKYYPNDDGAMGKINRMTANSLDKMLTEINAYDRIQELISEKDCLVYLISRRKSLVHILNTISRLKIRTQLTKKLWKQEQNCFKEIFKKYGLVQKFCLIKDEILFIMKFYGRYCIK